MLPLIRRNFLKERLHWKEICILKTAGYEQLPNNTVFTLFAFSYEHSEWTQRICF